MVQRLLLILITAWLVSACSWLQEPLALEANVLNRVQEPSLQNLVTRGLEDLPDEMSYAPIEVFIDYTPIGLVEGYMGPWGESVYVPICSLHTLLQTNCEWDENLRRLEVRYNNKSVSLSQDGRSQWRLFYGDTSIPLNDGDIFFPSSDPQPYTHLSLLDFLGPVSWTYENTNLSIRGRARGNIPVLARKAFETRRHGQRANEDRLLAGDRSSMQDLPVLEVPQTPSLPLFDTHLNVTATKHEISSSGQIQTSMDLGLAALQFGVLLDQDEGIEGGRLSLETQVNGVHIHAGDVSSGDFRFLGSLRGVGASVQSGRQDEGFISFLLEGEGPAGWDVEVRARGFPFIAFTQVRPDGRWQIADTPIKPGGMIFDILLISPSGEIRQDLKVIESAPGAPMPGRYRWRATVLNEGARVFGRSHRRSDFWTGAASLDYGLRPGLGLRLGLGQARLQSNQRNTMSYVGLTHRYGRLQSRLDVAYDGSKMGLAVDQSLSLNKTRLALSSQYTQDGFNGRAYGYSGRVRISRRFSQVSTSLGLSAQHANNKNVYGMQTNLTMRMLDWNIGVNTNTQFYVDDPNIGQLTTWNVNLAGFVLEKYRLRWALKGGKSLEGIQLNSSRTFNNDWQVGVSLDHDLDLSRTSLSVAISRDINKFKVRSQVSVNDEDVRATVTFATSFTPHPRARRYRQSLNPVGSQGVGALVSCIDENFNRKCEHDEPPVAGVRLEQGNIKTDEEGIAVITLPPWQNLQARVDLSSIENPFLTPQPEGHQVKLRPGRSVRIDLPMRRIGDVTGWVRFAGEEVSERVRVKIQSKVQGEFSHSVITGMDGFFFMSLPYGDYTVQTSSGESCGSLDFSVTEENPQPTLDIDAFFDCEGPIV